MIAAALLCVVAATPANAKSKETSGSAHRSWPKPAVASVAKPAAEPVREAQKAQPQEAPSESEAVASAPAAEATAPQSVSR